LVGCSTYLRDKVGDILDVSAPAGDFVLTPSAPRFSGSRRVRRHDRPVLAEHIVRTLPRREVMVVHAGPCRSRSCASPDGHRLYNFNSDIWYQHVDPDDTCSRQGHTDRAEGAPAQRIRVLASPAGESRPRLRYASSLTAAYHQTIQPTLNSQAGKCDETHPLVASMRPNLTLSLHWTVRPSIPRRRQCPTGLFPQTVGCRTQATIVANPHAPKPQCQVPQVHWRFDNWFPTLTVMSRLALVVSA
jgi:hypothetical protein